MEQRKDTIKLNVLPYFLIYVLLLRLAGWGPDFKLGINLPSVRALGTDIPGGRRTDQPSRGKKKKIFNVIKLSHLIILMQIDINLGAGWSEQLFPGQEVDQAVRGSVVWLNGSERGGGRKQINVGRRRQSVTERSTSSSRMGSPGRQIY